MSKEHSKYEGLIESFGSSLLGSDENIPETKNHTIDSDKLYYQKKHSISNRNVSLGKVGETVEREFAQVLSEMRALVHEFNHEFPVRVGFQGAYALSVVQCGKKNCPLCPHGLRWRRFDCVRKHGAKLVDTPGILMNGGDVFAPGLTQRSGLLDHYSLNSQFLNSKGTNISLPKNHAGRRTVVLWHNKRFTALPSTFFREHNRQPKKHFERFVWFNERMKLLNKRREFLSKVRTQILNADKILRSALFLAAENYE